MLVMRNQAVRRLAFVALAGALTAGCSVKKMAINTVGDALAEGNSVYATDEDPELVREAVPFGLKLVESLLEQSPKHRGLLLSAASGFTSYAYAFVQQDADYVEAEDLDRATQMRNRARKLYLRALGYGLRGLEVDVPGFGSQLRADKDAVLAKVTTRHVPLLYWTANAWGAAISISINDSSLTADQSLVEALMRRALALEEGYEAGSIHDFFIAWEAGRSSVGGSLDKARQHLERARALSKGRRVSPLVSFAESVSVGTQNQKEFEQLLKEALAFDVNAAPEFRVVNTLAQKRARWLLSRTGELF
jgi:predicted anti-sigma-YlaC factor YlaD